MPPRPPGPKPHFLIGNIPLASRDPLAVFSHWAREYGDLFYYRAGWIHVYFLNDPALIESVLVRNYQNFTKDHVVRNSRWLFGDGLLTSEGDYWRRQRRLSQPALHREWIASYASLMTSYAEQMLPNCARLSSERNLRVADHLRTWLSSLDARAFIVDSSSELEHRGVERPESLGDFRLDPFVGAARFQNHRAACGTREIHEPLDLRWMPKAFPPSAYNPASAPRSMPDLCSEKPRPRHRMCSLTEPSARRKIRRANRNHREV